MSDVEADLDCVERGALIKKTTLGTIRVTGKDRLTWLNGLVTCDLAPRKPGDAVYGLAVGKTGKILDEVYVLVGEEDLLVGVEGAHAAELVSTLDRYLVMEDAEIAVADGFVWRLAIGPRAKDAVSPSRAAAARAGITERAGLPLAVVCAAGATEAAVVSAIEAACAPSRVASDDGWYRVRVEHGIAAYGVDFDRENYPQEPALEKDGVSFNKGCYLGQEAVFMLEKRGHVKKRLVQLAVDGAVAVGDAIATAEGAEIGKVTSAITHTASSMSTSGRTSLALGYVKYKYAVEGGEVVTGKSPAKVTALLAIKPEG
jgi:tRNA-modifying protein YgfZ